MRRSGVKRLLGPTVTVTVSPSWYGPDGVMPTVGELAALGVTLTMSTAPVQKANRRIDTNQVFGLRRIGMGVLHLTTSP